MTARRHIDLLRYLAYGEGWVTHIDPMTGKYWPTKSMG